jgi:hypothetical protein
VKEESDKNIPLTDLIGTYKEIVFDDNREGLYDTHTRAFSDDRVKRDLREVYSRSYRDHLRWYGCPDIDRKHLLAAYELTNAELDNILNNMEKDPNIGLSKKHRK